MTAASKPVGFGYPPLIWTEEDTKLVAEARERNRRLGGLRFSTSYEELRAISEEIQLGGDSAIERMEREMYREILTNLMVMASHGEYPYRR